MCIYINKYSVPCRSKPLYSPEISQTSPFQSYEVVLTENNYVCFQTRRQCMASQVHIYSLNLSLNFKPRFEVFKLGFENFKPRFQRQSAH